MTNLNNNKLEAIDSFKNEVWALKRIGKEIHEVKMLFRREEYSCFDRLDFEALMKWVKEEVYSANSRKYTLKKVFEEKVINSDGEEETVCIKQVVGCR